MAGQNVDLGGDNLIVNDIFYGATAPGQAGTKLDSALLTSLQASGSIAYTLTGVNFNSATTDNPVTITLPSGFTRYLVSGVYLSHASHTLVTATVGVFTAVSGGGVAIAADQAITVASSSDATNTNAMVLTITNANTRSYTAATLYVRIGTAEGAAATADVTVVITPLP